MQKQILNLLSFEVVQDAYLKLIKMAQIESFSRECNDCIQIITKSSILSLSAFMDFKRIRRVDGSLKNANYD